MSRQHMSLRVFFWIFCRIHRQPAGQGSGIHLKKHVHQHTTPDAHNVQQQTFASTSAVVPACTYSTDRDTCSVCEGRLRIEHGHCNALFAACVHTIARKRGLLEGSHVF